MPKIPVTTVPVFYELLPNNADKIIVLNLAITTQVMRVKKAGNEARAQCIDGLEVKVSDDGRAVIPAAFRQDIMKKLADLRNDKPSNYNAVENVVMNAITKNCGSE